MYEVYLERAAEQESFTRSMTLRRLCGYSGSDIVEMRIGRFGVGRDGLALSQALTQVMNVVRQINAYLERTAP